MTEFNFGLNFDDQIRILKESIGLNSKDLSPNILNNYYYPFIVGVFNEKTDSSYNIKLEFIKPSEGVFEKPEVLNIDLNTELGKNIIFRMRDDIFKKHNEGMGHLLAEACIKIESNVPIFYSRIGYETVENKYQNVNQIYIKISPVLSRKQNRKGEE